MDPYHARRLLVGATFAVAAVAAACQILVPLEPSPIANDAGVDGGEDAIQEEAGPSCGRRPPPPKATPPSPGRSYFFVIPGKPLPVDAGDEASVPPPSTTVPSELLSGLGAEGGVGFDLDCKHTDSESPDADSACVPRGAAARDLPDGVDDNLRAAAARFNYDLTSFSYTRRVNAGTAGLIIGVLDYTGEDNDDAVGVAALLSGGVRDPNGCQDAGRPRNGVYRSLFNGCDQHWSGPAFMTKTAVLPTAVASGYVVDGTLVLRDSLTVYLPQNDRYVKAEAMAAEARIVRDDAGAPIGLVGTIGGRVAAEDALKMLGGAPTPDGGATCHAPDIWPLAQAGLCEALDMPSADASANDRCGALSFSIPFTAIGVLVAGSQWPVLEADAACTDVAPSEFSCP